MASWISTRNLLTNATIYGTSHAEVAGFPKTNILQPERPYKTVRTPSTTGDQDIFLDLGTAAVTYNYIIITNTNYANWSIGLSANPTFAPGLAPSPVCTPMTVRCPWNTRYVRMASITGAAMTGRYLLFRIPGGQATRDGAAYYSTGGLWLGMAENLDTILGRSWKWAYTFGPIYPEMKIGPSHQGWSRTVRRGNPRATLTATLEPDVNGDVPGGSGGIDGLNAWLDLQWRIRENYFCALIEDWDPSHALICEDLTPPPVVDYPVATVDLRFEEAV